MIEKRIEEIKSDLDLFENELEKYDYIIDLGKELGDFDEKRKKEEFLVKGCTSNLWLYPEIKEGKIFFYADADAVVVKGLTKIFLDVFSNTDPKEIVEFERDLLKELGLSELISVGRQNGFSKAIEKIKQYALGVS